MDGSYESINEMSMFKLKEGVTSFMPTTVTASDELTEAAVTSVREACEKGTGGANVLGIFLEGPYINPKNKGAHPEEFIRPTEREDVLSFVTKAKMPEGGLISIAIAPELPGAAECITALRERGVHVRIGHSSAKYAEANAAVEAGANMNIHTYNAMSALNHREPGMVGAALANENLYTEIICDLVHVHAAAVRILANAKAEKVVLMTDCMQAGGLPDGNYKLGELPVIVTNNEARLADGTLAGSTAALNKCLKNMHRAVGVPLPLAVVMATEAPAKALGIFDRVGSLEAGKQADIVALDENFDVKFVMVNGDVKLWNANT
jgi:N-acetylglucosamine-6-phosphate deacetylase